jgi:hypothetical protein
MPSLSRRRGAQPGNRNALKHGYYSPTFKKISLSNGETIPIFDLRDEIAILRLYARRVIAMSNGTGSFAESVDLLRILSLAYATLTRLVTTQYLVCNPQDERDEAIDQAIQELFGDRPLFKDPGDSQDPAADRPDDPSGPRFDPRHPDP